MELCHNMLYVTTITASLGPKYIYVFNSQDFVNKPVNFMQVMVVSTCLSNYILQFFVYTYKHVNWPAHKVYRIVQKFQGTKAFMVRSTYMRIFA